MSLYLLDTNILSALVRDPAGPAGVRLSLVGQENAFTSIIVASEVRFGLARKRSPRLRRDMEGLLALMTVARFEEPADQIYGDMRADLEARGALIGQNDMLIAAHALSLGAILVTDNTREFTRVPGLKIENWLGV